MNFVDHIILTRFSFRGKEAFRKQSESKMWRLYDDPLLPENLEYRFKLFEIFALPAILNQSQQHFKWVLLIDRALPLEYFEKLKNLIHDREETYLHTYKPEIILEQSDWLTPYVNDKAKYLITTNLDDDDVLPVNYVESIQKHVEGLLETGKLPPAKIFATTNVKQWDLVTSSKSPFGLICAKLRTPSNIGFSLLTRRDYKLIVWGLRHTLADVYFNLQDNKKHKNLEYVRKAFRFHEEENEFRQWKPEDLFFDPGTITPPVLLINHFKNVQQWRLHKSKDDCNKVVKEEDINGVAINLYLLKKYAADFSKRKAFLYMMHVLLSRKYQFNNIGGRPARIKNYIILLRWYFWR